MNDHKCTHPDHNDNETCKDRAVACNANCRCCLVPENRSYVPADTQKLIDIFNHLTMVKNALRYIKDKPDTPFDKHDEEFRQTHIAARETLVQDLLDTFFRGW